MKNMNRETALLVTAASAILCACPGLVMCSSSLISMLASIDAPSSEAGIIQGVSAGMLCLGLASVLIPVAVGYFTLRPSRLEEAQILEDTGKPKEMDDTIPPAI